MRQTANACASPDSPALCANQVRHTLKTQDSTTEKRLGYHSFLSFGLRDHKLGSETPTIVNVYLVRMNEQANKRMIQRCALRYQNNPFGLFLCILHMIKGS